MFVGTGDDIAKSPLATLLGGRHITDALNYLQPAAAAIGNHEFDYGTPVLRRRIAESSFPWVAANLLTNDGQPVLGSKRWVTTSVGDLTVGVFGLVPQNVAAMQLGFPDDYQVLNNVPAARTAVDVLEAAGAEYVVCASHLALAGTKTVAERVDGIDVIVGDHTEHVFEHPRSINGTVVNTVGAGFHHVGALTLDQNGLRRWQRRRITPSVRPDPGMGAISEQWRHTISMSGTSVTFPP
jgi:2',3'-cyclic-nucleotide 2'-phosphodiesterase (5'-nucleotidase family)